MSWARVAKPKVTRAQIKAATSGGQPVPEGKRDDFNAYMERLVQLIPAEIVALYLTFHASSDPDGSFALWWPIICVVLVLLVRVVGTLPSGAPVWRFWLCQPIAVGVAAISFVLWIYAIGDKIWNFAVSEPIWVSAGIAIWTIVVPVFYKGD